MQVYDIAIIGAGPAGLSAALYAARFRRRTIVLHDGKARAARIPLTHNVPGFPDGIAGPELLARMQAHAERYGAQCIEAHIDAVEFGPPFALSTADGRGWRARALILATGIELNQIDLPGELHEAAIAAGILRYCPICDGYEHRGERVAIVGCSSSGAAEALFMQNYSSDVTLLPRQDVELSKAERDELRAAGIAIVTDPIAGYQPLSDAMRISFGNRREAMDFDIVYPALGVRPRNRLALQLGLETDRDGNVPARAPLGTAVPGLFCAGDIVEGLDQISVAMGHGAIAATRAHNWLRSQDGETVDAVLDHGE